MGSGTLAHSRLYVFTEARQKSCQSAVRSCQKAVKAVKSLSKLSTTVNAREHTALEAAKGTNLSPAAFQSCQSGPSCLVCGSSLRT